MARKTKHYNSLSFFSASSIASKDERAKCMSKISGTFPSGFLRKKVIFEPSEE
jgi:hypothetical protein